MRFALKSFLENKSNPKEKDSDKKVFCEMEKMMMIYEDDDDNDDYDDAGVSLIERRDTGTLGQPLARRWCRAD